MHSTTRVPGSYGRSLHSNRGATLLLAATFVALAAVPPMACDGCVVWPDEDRTHGPPIHIGDCGRHLLGEGEYDEYLTAEREQVDLEYDVR